MQGQALQATSHQFGHHRPGGHPGLHPAHFGRHHASAGDHGSTGGHSDDDGLDVGGIEDLGLAAHHHRLFSGKASIFRQVEASM